MKSPFYLLKVVGKLAYNVLLNGDSEVGDDLAALSGSICEDVWGLWCRESNEAQRRAELEAMAQASAQEVKDQVAAIVKDVAAGQAPAVQQRLTSYLTQIPSMVRQATRRASDPTGRTIPSYLRLQQSQEVLQFLPSRAPRFQPGQRPIAGVDLELVELLGVGGFGEVWKASATSTTAARSIPTSTSTSSCQRPTSSPRGARPRWANWVCSSSAMS